MLIISSPKKCENVKKNTKGPPNKIWPSIAQIAAKQSITAINAKMMDALTAAGN